MHLFGVSGVLENFYINTKGRAFSLLGQDLPAGTSLGERQELQYEETDRNPDEEGTCEVE